MTPTASSSSLMTYILRSILMYTPLAEQVVHALVRERQTQAEAQVRARRLLTLRRWQRRADTANRQVRLARLNVR